MTKLRFVGPALSLLLAAWATPSPAAPLEMAITIDDLPVHAPFPPGTDAVASSTKARMPSSATQPDAFLPNTATGLRPYRAYTDPSLPAPPPVWQMAQQKGVSLPKESDYSAKLTAMCTGGAPTTTP